MSALGTSDPLQDRYNLIEGEIFLSGVHALARLPIDVMRRDQREGLNTATYISGYEGSPLSGYDLELSRHQEILLANNIHFQPGLNEELAATAVQGSQLVATYQGATVTGVVGFWYGKSPGFDRSVDAFRHNNLAGTHHYGGAIAIVGDDPGAKSSTVPGASEILMAELGMPILYPADPQDILDLGIHAVMMSRASGLWVGMKITTNVADGSSTAQVHPDRITSLAPIVMSNNQPYIHQVTGRLLQPNLTGLERSRNGVRLEIARKYGELNQLNRITISHPHDQIGIVAAGRTYLDLMQALRILGIGERELELQGVRLLQLRMINPLDTQFLRGFASGLKEIIVVEEKRAFIESALRNQLYSMENAPIITGKEDPRGVQLFQSENELNPDLIALSLARRLIEVGTFPQLELWLSKMQAIKPRVDLPLAIRMPYFCSGCPHNTSMKSPDGSLVGGGIGCHSLALLMDPKQVGNVMGLTQMGGEGAQWIGMAPFIDKDHLLQNLGDGTFHHSGSLAIRAAIAAKVNITYKLLYNSVVALTGGQSPVGVMSVPTIAEELILEGVKKIIITTEKPKDYKKFKLPAQVEVWHRDRVVEAQEVLSKIGGVSVLIHDQECATELRRKRKRGKIEKPVNRIMINERVCEGCGDCGEKSNCLSVQPIETKYGRKTHIDQSSCNVDLTCLKGDCPSFILVKPSNKKVAQEVEQAKEIKAWTHSDLPEPTYIVSTTKHVTRILGVGGTGVVTLTQILGVAATLAGKKVRTLDQTGMAQKGGAVIADIKISDDDELESNKCADGECDLYLGADLLVAADPKNLVVNNPERTIAVISTTKVATGQMVIDTGFQFPKLDNLMAPIQRTVRSDKTLTMDAREVAREICGDDQYANMVLAGAAYQLGALPISFQHIQRAIELNGVAIAHNLNAFQAGRRAVAEPDRLLTLVNSQKWDSKSPREGSAAIDSLVASLGISNPELRVLIADRYSELVKYQNKSYATDFFDFLNAIQKVQVNRELADTTFMTAITKNLFKLMAYKDEYEVARLSIDPQVKKNLELQFGVGSEMTFMLHPPMLRALGMKKKIKLGSWFKPFFEILAKMKGIRGSKFDLFGYAEVRKVERALITQYKKEILELLPQLNLTNLDVAIQIAELPDLIRGYESIKLRNVEIYQEQLNNLRKEFHQLVSH
jgi:indolepyruvate ferredoxin oxidoreductase